MEDVRVGVSKKSVSWTSRFVMMVLQENGRRSDVTLLVKTFWTLPCNYHHPLELEVVGRV